MMQAKTLVQAGKLIKTKATCINGIVKVMKMTNGQKVKVNSLNELHAIANSQLQSISHVTTENQQTSNIISLLHIK